MLYQKPAAFAAAAVAVGAGPATAGGMAEPVMEMAPEIVVEEAAGTTSNAGLIIPLILIALIAAAASSSGSSEPTNGTYVGNASDIRLKQDIVPVGETPSGLTLYEFSYLGQSDRFVGVMAQEVLSHTPSAVMRHPTGVLMVDYGQIDAEMIKLD